MCVRTQSYACLCSRVSAFKKASGITQGAVLKLEGAAREEKLSRIAERDSFTQLKKNVFYQESDMNMANGPSIHVEFSPLLQIYGRIRQTF